MKRARASSSVTATPVPCTLSPVKFLSTDGRDDSRTSITYRRAVANAEEEEDHVEYLAFSRRCSSHSKDTSLVNPNQSAHRLNSSNKFDHASSNSCPSNKKRKRKNENDDRDRMGTDQDSPSPFKSNTLSFLEVRDPVEIVCRLFSQHDGYTDNVKDGLDDPSDDLSDDSSAPDDNPTSRSAVSDSDSANGEEDEDEIVCQSCESGKDAARLLQQQLQLLLSCCSSNCSSAAASAAAHLLHDCCSAALELLSSAAARLLLSCCSSCCSSSRSQSLIGPL